LRKDDARLAGANRYLLCLERLGAVGCNALKESASLREERHTSTNTVGRTEEIRNPGKSTYDKPVVREPDAHYFSSRYSGRQRNSMRDADLPLSLHCGACTQVRSEEPRSAA
jgi:hypothetical protein